LLDWIHAPAQVPEPNQFDLTQVVTVPNVQTDLSLIDIDNTDNVVEVDEAASPLALTGQYLFRQTSDTSQCV